MCGARPLQAGKRCQLTSDSCGRTFQRFIKIVLRRVIQQSKKRLGLKFFARLMALRGVVDDPLNNPWFDRLAHHFAGDCSAAAESHSLMQATAPASMARLKTFCAILFGSSSERPAASRSLRTTALKS